MWASFFAHCDTEACARLPAATKSIPSTYLARFPSLVCIRSGHGARNMQSPRTNFSDSYRDVFLVAVRAIRAVTLIQRQLSAATEVGSSAGKADC